VFLFTAFLNVQTTVWFEHSKRQQAKEAVGRTISAVTGISVMVEIVLRCVFGGIKMVGFGCVFVKK
jgi:hypothetical protein